MNWETYWDYEFLKQPGPIAIFGAQMVAVGIYYAIKTLYNGCRINSFIVSDMSGNPSEIDEIPVVTLEEFDKTDVKILVAVPEIHHGDIRAGLERRELRDYLCVDSKGESVLMERYYAATGYFPILHRLGINSVKNSISEVKKISLSVFLTKFYKDRPLSERRDLPAWIYPIQAGAALTDVRIADLCDNVGENISSKNGNYSELTSTYWIGKHVDDDYLGLFHYRRILDITDEDLYRVNVNHVDVILPYPTLHYPDIGQHHKRYIKEEDWDAMILALKKCSPAYAAALPDIFANKYFYNYNMFVAKQYIWKDYCDWLFPILECTEELSVPRGSERADRYIGYLGENLTTLYFMYHQKDFNIAHTGRLMLV